MHLSGQNLELGMRVEDIPDVQILHAELQRLGYEELYPDLRQDMEAGVFGEATHNAVIAFKQTRGLPLDPDPAIACIVDDATAHAINLAVDALAPEEFTVTGRVFHQYGTSLIGLTVQAFDKDLRREERLGEAVTQPEEGEYTIHYTKDKFTRAEKKRADLIVRAYSPEGGLLAESPIHFNAENYEWIELQVEPQEQAPLSDYERLLAEITPLLDDVALADLTDDDIQFLAQELESREEVREYLTREIQYLRQAAQLAQTIDLPMEALYAWGRFIGAEPLTLEILRQSPPDDWMHPLRQAIAEHWIPALDEPTLEAIRAQLEALYLAAHPPTDHQVTFRLRQPATAYNLDLRTLGSVDDIPQAGQRVVFVVKLDATYHARIFDEAGTMVLDRGGDAFVPDNNLIHRLDDAMSQETLDEPTKRELIALITEQLDHPLPQETEAAPLVGFILQAQRLEPSGDWTDLGWAISDGEGQCTFPYTTPHGEDPTQRPFHLEIFLPEDDQREQPFATVDVEVPPGLDVVIDLEIEVPEPEEPPSPAIEEVMDVARIPDRPPALNAYLQEHHLETIADIRRAGGLPRQADWSEADTAVAEILESHANLSILPSPVGINQELINSGFHNILEIADTPQAEFVDRVTADVPAEGRPDVQMQMVQIHQTALQQTLYLNNLITAYATERANGFDTPFAHKMQEILASHDGTSTIPDDCQCPDCKSAVSPLAYLADLTDYTLKKVRNNGNPLTFEDLKDNFYQPFGELPVACEEMDKKVRQVRLCIEVLRQYREAQKRDPAYKEDAEAEKALQTAEADYRLDAFQTLLTQLGGSYDELRLLRPQNKEALEAFANRFGIDPHPDHIQRLTDLARNPQNIDESDLEQLFGLQDTDVNRDVLSDGAKIPKDNTILKRWNLKGIVWNRHTDAEGKLYLQLNSLSIDRINQSKLYRSPKRQPSDEVASVLRQDDTGSQITLHFYAKGDSDFLASLTFQTPLPHNDAIEIVAIPHVLSWRLQRLRTLWQQMDWPEDDFGTKLPILDPDLIGPDDFRWPFSETQDYAQIDTAFDLWLYRRNWADFQLACFASQVLEVAADQPLLVEGQLVPNLTGMFGMMYDLAALNYPFQAPAEAVSPWWPQDIHDNFRELLRQLDRAEDLEFITAIIQDQLNLTIASFRRLMALWDKDEKWRQANLPPQAPSEQKTVNVPRVSPEEWREVYSILLQAQKTFLRETWIQEEQRLNITLSSQIFWPAQRTPLEGEWPSIFPMTLPIIDPELQTLQDLAQPFIGIEVRSLWEDRKKALNNLTNQLQQASTQSFDVLLQLGLGNLVNQLDTWNQQLADQDKDTRKAAIEIIETQLRISVDEFTHLMSVKANAEAGQSIKQELPQIIAILRKSTKYRQRYAVWAVEQVGIAIDTPIIDPDELNLKDLAEQMVGERAIELWHQRQQELQAKFDAFEQKYQQQGLEDLLADADALDLSTEQRKALSDDRSKGGQAQQAAERTITNELHLTVEDFDRLMDIDEKDRPTEQDLEQVFAILVKSFKYRILYAQWAQEQTNLGRTYWQTLKARLPKWRAPMETRQGWQQILKVQSQPPVIDPDLLINDEYFQSSQLGQKAQNLWKDRQEIITRQVDGLLVLQQAYAKNPLSSFDNLLQASFFGQARWPLTQMTQQREQRGYEVVLQQVFGEFAEQLDDLQAALNNLQTAAETRRIIRQSLHVNLDDFASLMAIRAKAKLGQAVTNAEWQTFDEILAMAKFVKSFMALEQQRADGEDIGARLKQLGLSHAAFAYLVRCRQLIVEADLGANPLQATEWKAIASILTQVLKQLYFSEWRNEEQRQGIILSPDAFQLVEPDPDQPYTPIGSDLPEWRANRLDYLDWRDKLEARIEQQTTTITAFAEAISSAEEVILPPLRDALILSSNAQETNLSEKAKTLTDLLLIDTQAGGCQKTTRISQAIETLQNLLWSIRTGQLYGTYKQLTLADPTNFDEEWQWMGSYTPWRAAMFVFIYPENILFPSLRTRQTPAFRRLVSNLRKQRSLTPKEAAKEAESYERYLRDVCSLKIKAFCQTSIDLKDQGSKISKQMKIYIHFAIGEYTNTVYFLVHLSDNAANSESWFPIESLSQNVEEIVGSQPYKDPEGNHFIYLFVRLKSKVNADFGLVKFNLNDIDQDLPGQWSEFTSLELPSKPEDFKIVVQQSSYEDFAPWIAIQSKQKENSGLILARQLNQEGTGWANIIFKQIEVSFSNGWKVLKYTPSSADMLLAMVDTVPSEFFVILGPNPEHQYGTVYGANAEISYRLFGEYDDGRWHGISSVPSEFIYSVFAYNVTDNSDLILISKDSADDVYCRITVKRPEKIELQKARTAPSNNDPKRSAKYKIDEFGRWLKEITGYDFNSCFRSIGLNFLEKPSTLPPYRSNWSKLIEEEEDSELKKAVEIAEDVLEKGGYKYGHPKYHMIMDIIDNILGGFDFGLSVEKFELFLPFRNDVEKSDKVNFNLNSEFEIDYIVPSSGPGKAWLFSSLIKKKVDGTQITNIRYALMDFYYQPGPGLPLIGPIGFVGASLSPMALSLPEISNNIVNLDLQERRIQIEIIYKINDKFIYLEEAFYFVPVQIAIQLLNSGYYVAALDWLRTIYDYITPETEASSVSRISWFLAREKILDFKGYERDDSWLLNPLDPHSIAISRPDTYTRFTLLLIIKCLLKYADAEFVNDTVESISKARILYRTVLDLFEIDLLSSKKNECRKKVGELRIEFQKLSTETRKALERIEKLLLKINNVSVIQKLIPLIWQLVGDGRVEDAEVLVRQEIYNQLISRSMSTVTQSNIKAVAAAHGQLISREENFNNVRELKIEPEKLFPGTQKRFLVSKGSLMFKFCISPNPVFHALRLQAKLNLQKLQSCRNIVGMKREIEPYASPSEQISGLPSLSSVAQLIPFKATNISPTLYRYTFLLERSKQLVNLAQQMEAAMLSAFEKRDAEAYTQLKARQDIQLTRSQVRLQTLRLGEARNSVILAELQRERSVIQFDHYQNLLEADLLAVEIASLIFMSAAIAASYTPWSFSVAQALSTKASLAATIASFERRKQDWRFQRDLANQDIRIGSQQIRVSQDRVAITEQEVTIARLQTDHAKDTLEFLTNKFTNVELYDWMSGVLEGVYSYFLQEATAVAKLAEHQLAFERQQMPPQFIQADYWEAPSEDMGLSLQGNAPDRRGLTGSARLLQDIYQLNNYAIETDQRKLQLTKTISLSTLAPVEFQQFRETGVLTFRTTLEMFDRDFPGHYLRLIKRVRTSVLALIPPTQGIHATLSTTAASRVVIGGDIFQTVIVRRDPEQVALTSPQDATGLFELQQQSEMLLPFESLGVDTSWEFRMPKAANQFDYSTIADVLLTLEYTALNSYDYQQQVIQTLNPNLSADRPFSFRHQFSDAWYDLHNPDQTATPLEVSFETRRADFPPNLERLKIDQITLYFALKTGETFEVPVNLQFTEASLPGQEANPRIGGDATTVDGIISTRRGNGGSWLALQGKAPVGKWELSIVAPDKGRENQFRAWFTDGQIEDILFVISYKGLTPAWPE
jgi:hypothetical protein